MILHAARQDLDQEISPDVRGVVDGDALRQALLNLLDTAVKYGPPGQRIRAVVVWHACATTGSGNGPAPRGVDFDLFLNNTSTQKWVYGSQSIDDVSEGFDIIVPTAGVHETWIRWPKTGNGSNCANSPTENYAFAWVTPL